MLGSVVAKTVRDARRGLFWWSAGIAALVVLTVLVYPTVRDNPDYDRLAQDYPDALKAFFGEDVTSPAGYLHSQLFSFMVPLLLLVYAVAAGARAIAGEEEAGTLDLLLSLPISRSRLVLEKAAALAVQLGMLSFTLFGSVLGSAQLVSMDIPVSSVIAAVAGAYLLALGYGAIGLLVGAAAGRRSLAAGVAAALAAAGYLLNGLGQVVDVLEPWRVLSAFEWLGEPVRDGLPFGDATALLAATVAAAALAPVLFVRRDIAV